MADDDPSAPRRNLHWLPLYHRDLNSSTADWTDEEFGAYMRLLIHQWERGSIPTDPQRLGRISDTAKKHWRLLGPKFPNGMNPKMTEVREQRELICERRSEAGRRGRAAQLSGQLPKQTPAIAQAGQSQSQSQNTETETTPPTPLSAAPRKPKPELPPVEFPQPLDTPKFREAWDAWLEYKGRAYKPVSQRTLLKQLAEKGHDDAIARIERSIANQWAGLIFADERGTGNARSVGRKAQDAHDAASERRAARSRRDFPETDEPIPDPFAGGPIPFRAPAGTLAPLQHPGTPQGKHAG